MLKNYRNKVKELKARNLELENQIKEKLGLQESDVLPADWAKELVKKIETESTNELLAEKDKEDLELQNLIRLAEEAKIEAESKHIEEKSAKEQVLQEKDTLIAQLEEANDAREKAEAVQAKLADELETVLQRI